MKTTVIILVVVALTNVYCLDDDRGDLSEKGFNITFADLPKDTQGDFFKIITGATNALGGSCVGIEPNYNKVELLLYTNDPSHSTRVYPENPVGIDNNEPLYVLSHGWCSGLNGYKIKEFRDQYIKIFGKNILFINWGKLAWYPYTTAACNIPFIGQYVAKFLCALSEKHGYDLSKVHFIGHSLGGQLGGQTGKGTQKQCNKKIGKITGLDPAGPMFQFQKEEGRLTPNDADFVEAIHSNSGMFGYLGKAGTVDYHLNCGTLQPGCIIPQDFTKIAETNIYFLCCAHMRSVDVWTHALDTDGFKGKSCKLCGGIMPTSCVPDLVGHFVSMGRFFKKAQGEHYNVVTGPYPPFSLGCKPFLFQGCS